MAESQQKRGGHYSQQLKNLQRRINSPKTDLLETEKQYIVRMELSVKSFSWELREEQFLFVSFDKEQDNFGEVKELYREAKYGKTMRRVKLPGKVLASLASESYENGVWIAYFNKQNSDPVILPNPSESWADS
jgi:HSP20 family molecular chaperone IbpA